MYFEIAEYSKINRHLQAGLPSLFFFSLFSLLPPRGFDLPTLGAISRRICPQDHGAPLHPCFRILCGGQIFYLNHLCQNLFFPFSTRLLLIRESIRCQPNWAVKILLPKLPCRIVSPFATNSSGLGDKVPFKTKTKVIFGTDFTFLGCHFLGPIFILDLKKIYLKIKIFDIKKYYITQGWTCKHLLFKK